VKMMKQATALLLVIVLAIPGLAQPPPRQQPQSGTAQQQGVIPDAASRLRPNYVLQVGDQIVVRSATIEEIGQRPFRVDEDGTIQLPVPQVAPVRALGRTVEEFEAALVAELKKYFTDPQISVTVSMFNTPPVFLVGAFRSPGVKALRGRVTLVELITAEGGVLPSAGKRLRLTRRSDSGPIPLQNALPSPDGKSSFVEINVEKLQSAMSPEEDIALEPFDVISIDKAEQIFFMGAVNKTGPVEIGERKSISMLQALSIAGGPSQEAKLAKAYILRPVMNTAERGEVRVDLKRIIDGRDADIPLMPNDVVYIPGGPGFFARNQWLRQVLLTTGASVITAILFARIQN
jgi:polysaccharide biosynthesis/export protein